MIPNGPFPTCHQFSLSDTPRSAGGLRCRCRRYTERSGVGRDGSAALVPGPHRGGAAAARGGAGRAAGVALDVKVILTPPCVIIPLVILHTKYAGLRENEFNAHA